MKIELIYLKGKTEPWAETACKELETKISYFFEFNRVEIKAKSEPRSHAKDKTAAEGQSLLAKISKNDFLILFDEKGREFSSSVEFSNKLVSLLSGSKNRLIFAIGGPYGFSQEVLDRAQQKWSLGRLTMNHHVAQVMAMEQIYRALTIWKGLPYHNA